MTSDTKYSAPAPPTPPPLRGSEAGTFAHYSVTVRLPDIGRRMIAENDFSMEIAGNLAALIGEIPEGLICPLKDRSAPDFGAWTRYIEPYLGQNWLEVPWFFAETYFYRRALDAIGYFEPGPGHGLDPFAWQKRQGLETNAEAIGSLASGLSMQLAEDDRDEQAKLRRVVKKNLWGNQADLSLWPAGDGEGPGRAEEADRDERILVDDSQNVSKFLSDKQRKHGRVDFIMDNAALELVNDLALADYLLGTGLTESVRLHLKSHPTFVSDAMVKDVQLAIAYLYASSDSQVQDLGKRLEQHVRAERFQLVEDFFWTSPLAFWEMPATLRTELSYADLLISKGDANYRRLLGDRHWPFITPAEDVLRYVPAPLVALRVCKSEVIVGLRPGQPEELDQVDPDWKINGEWGMIQFVRP